MIHDAALTNRLTCRKAITSPNHSNTINPKTPAARPATAPVSLLINAGAAPTTEFVLVLTAAAVSAMVEDRDDVVLVALDALELVGSPDPSPTTLVEVPVLRVLEAVREEPLPAVRLGEKDSVPPSAHL